PSLSSSFKSRRCPQAKDQATMGIFFNQDNLVLAAPLIALCSGWAFIKFVPLKVGLPALGAVLLLIQARAKFIASRSTDEHVDKTLVKDLMSEEDELAAKQETKEAKKQRKANQKLRERLKAERKNHPRNRGEAEDDVDDGELTKIAKGSRGKKKR
ncbi:hypothetical protein ACHAXT_010057, partial [Thalassiosira profunda]